MQIDITAVIAAVLSAAAIPSAITGFLIWRMQKKIDKREKEKERKEAAREKNEVMLIQKVDAALTLAEATARAVQRIPGRKMQRRHDQCSGICGVGEAAAQAIYDGTGGAQFV